MSSLKMAFLMNRQEKKEQAMRLFKMSQGKDAQEMSETVEQYLLFFQRSLEYLKDYNVLNIPLETQRKFEIKVMDSNCRHLRDLVSNKANYVQFVQSKIYGLQCAYEVLIGNFYLTIKILNVPYDTDDSRKADQKTLGTGSFGIVKLAQVDGTKIAVKRLFFHNLEPSATIPGLLDPNDLCHYKKIKRAVEEYSMYKICSMLEIGPKVNFNNTYDLVCYNNGIQFYMELCSDPRGYLKQGYEYDLKNSVALLHKLKFVHNDIKPTNILYSPSLDKLVLIDFGLTHPICQNITERTKTNRKGTPGFFSFEMASIPPNQFGLVNLYYNDMHALRNSLRNLHQLGSESSECSFTSNQLSYIERSLTSEQNSTENHSASRVSEQIKSISSETSSTVSQMSNQFSIFINSNASFGYYMMRAVYELLNGVTDKEQSYWQCLKQSQFLKTKLFRQTTVGKVCCNQKNRNCQSSVLQMVNCLLLPYEIEENCLIFSVRNTLRAFGEHSQQFLEKLQSKEVGELTLIDKDRLQYTLHHCKRKKEAVENREIDVVLLNFQRNILFFFNPKRLKSELKILIEYIIAKKKQQFGSDFGQLEKQQKEQTLSQNQISLIQKSIVRVCIKLLERNTLELSYFPKIHEFLHLSFDRILDNQQQQQELPSSQQFFNAYFQLNEREEDQFRHDKDEKKYFYDKYNLLIHLYRCVKVMGFRRKYAIGMLFGAFYGMECVRMSDQFILAKVTQYRRIFEKEFFQKCNMNNINSEQNKQIKFDYFSAISEQIYPQLLINGVQKVLQIISPVLEFLKADIQHPECVVNIYKILARAYFKSNKFDSAQEIIDRIDDIENNYFFLKNNSRKSYKYYLLKAQYHIHRKQYEKAIKYIKKQIELAEESIHVAQDCSYLRNLYTQLNILYHRENQPVLAERAIRKAAYFYTSDWNINHFGFIGVHITELIKINRVKDIWKPMQIYLEKRSKYWKSISCPLTYRIKHRFQTPFGEKFYRSCGTLEKKTLIHFKIMTIKTLDQYLPFALKQFRNFCLEVADYLIIELDHKYRALSFIWLYFHRYPLMNVYLNEKNELFFERLNAFATLLMSFNLHKQALMTLQKFAYRLPDSYQNLKTLTFNNLLKASRSAKDRKKQFYSLLCNYELKPYETTINKELFIIQLKQNFLVDVHPALSRIYIKKAGALSFQNSNENQFEENILWKQSEYEGKYQVSQFYDLIRRKRK